MLIVASDRISVFDVVLDDLIPDKGRVLTALSTFWFDADRRPRCPNHLVSVDPTDFPETAGADARGRAMLVRRTRAGAARVRRPRLPVRRRRGTEYQEHGTVQGRTLPAGLRQAERLPEPIFTPTTKAESGPRPAARPTPRRPTLVGDDVFERLRDLTLRSTSSGAAHARASAGLILADTKLEFGTHRRRAARDRRDAHARLVALLAGRGLRDRRRRRRRSTSSTCATTTSRIGLGPRRRRRRGCPTRSSTGTRAALRRGLRAAHRRELRRLVRRE